ncbi:CatB-related O-acetyltransferase [Pseudomonas aeruginosa]|uniref:CatB-related O-acetyltransferase n=1 Tax=Pseudomonas aeruginosa TaxID=287 RepID=UPI003968356B
MGYLKNHWWKRWIRRRGCKLAGGPASVGKRTTLVLEERVELGHLRIVPPRLEIGAYSYVRSGTDLSLVASIGRFCSIGSDCFIGQEKHTHPSDWVSSHPFQHTGTALRYEPALSYAEIGHDVWIGHSAMVMEGVKVGTGAIIATRAVVTRDVPPYAIVAGTPAQVIRYRHPPEIIEGISGAALTKFLPGACWRKRSNMPNGRLGHSATVLRSPTPSASRRSSSRR